MLEAGQQKPIDYHQIKVEPDDIYTFIFTSGTTGAPKCSMYNNRSIMAFITTQYRDLMPIVRETDVELSVGPMTHMAERYLLYLLVGKGATIYMYCQDPNKLMLDFKESQPTIVVMAARFFNRIYDKIQQKIETLPAVKKFLVKLAFEQKISNLEKNGQTTHALWDRLIFNKLKKELLGEKIRFMMSGATPISRKVYNTIKVIYGVIFAQCYGSSETGCVNFMTHPLEKNAADTIGSV